MEQLKEILMAGDVIKLDEPINGFDTFMLGVKNGKSTAYYYCPGERKHMRSFKGDVDSLLDCEFTILQNVLLEKLAKEKGA